MNAVKFISPLPKPEQTAEGVNRLLVSVLLEGKDYHVEVYEDGVSIDYDIPPGIKGEYVLEDELFSLIAGAIL